MRIRAARCIASCGVFFCAAAVPPTGKEPGNLRKMGGRAIGEMRFFVALHPFLYYSKRDKEI